MSKLKNYYTTSRGTENDYYSETWIRYNIDDVIIQLVTKQRIIIVCIELSTDECTRVTNSMQ